jgi:hypothetical protein
MFIESGVPLDIMKCEFRQDLTLYVFIIYSRNFYVAIQ